LCSVLFLLSAHGQQAPAGLPFVNGAFTDDMVLQRGMAVPIWGWTKPGEKVTVSIQEKSVEAVADKEGRWMAKLGPLAEGGPFTVAIQGAQSMVFTNVLVGDVWLCSGQSNMQFGMGGVSNAQAEIAAATLPRIRFLTVPNVISALPEPTIRDARWQVCSPATVGGCSAVGFFFGKNLHQELNVPVGLICSSWGGTVAEAWTSGEALQTMPDFTNEFAALSRMADEQRSGGAGYAKAIAEWYRQNDAGSADAGGWEATDADDTEWKSMALPNARRTRRKGTASSRISKTTR